LFLAETYRKSPNALSASLSQAGSLGLCYLGDFLYLEEFSFLELCLPEGSWGYVLAFASGTAKGKTLAV